MRRILLAAVEAAPDASTPKQPSPGETVLGCVHEPDLNGCHFYYLGSPGICFTRPDGVSNTADWLLTCDACFMDFGENIHAALASKKFPIGCDMQWPDNYKVTYVKN